MLADHKQFISEGVRHAGSAVLATMGGMFDGMSGLRASVGAGSSIDFLEHRSYTPGDDPRLLDWNAYARTEKLTLKMFRDEVDPKFDLLFDCSKSMDLPESRKAEAALTIMGFLVTAAKNGRFSTLCGTAGKKLREIANLAEPISNWNGIVFDGNDDSPRIFERALADLRHRSVRILVSDLLWRCAPRLFLGKLARNAAAVAVVQVLAEADISPTVRGMATLRDSETGLEDEIFLDQNALDAYDEALTSLRSLWESSCRSVGAVFISLNAENFLENRNFSIFDD